MAFSLPLPPPIGLVCVGRGVCRGANFAFLVYDREKRLALPKWAQPAACSGCGALSRRSGRAQGLTPRGARPQRPRPRVPAPCKGQGEYSGPVEEPRRPENGSLSPGVLWESRIGEASVSLFRLYFVCPRPCRWPH